jgi:purine-binding chemotaxis protein CheW
MTITLSSISVLNFKLGKEILAVNVANVLEVLRNEGITPIPRSENFVRGIVQFRGEIITVIDFSEKLNLYDNDPTTGKVVIVFNVETSDHSFKVGILADDVMAVENVQQNEIKQVDEITHYYNPEYLEGVVSINDQFVIVLDINKVFSLEEIELIKKNVTNEKQ